MTIRKYISTEMNMNQSTMCLQSYCPVFSCFSRFIISAPVVFHVGVSENITVQAPGHTDAFDATISVKSYPDENVCYSSGSVNLSPENKFQNSTILTVCICLFKMYMPNIFGKIYIVLNIDGRD